MDKLRHILPGLMCLLLLNSSSFAASIGQIKAAGKNGAVTTEGVVTYVEPFECYIESADRSAGIWVMGNTAGVGIGSLVNVAGKYLSVSGEPSLISAIIEPVSGNVEIKPFAMSNSSLGGYLDGLGIWDIKQTQIPGDGSELQWSAAGGAANTGLLVKTWGKVNAVYYSPVNNVKWFYIDDGTAATADFTDKGILVYSDADVKKGQYVAVTGVSSVEPAIDYQNKLIRVLRTRGSGDVQVINDMAKPTYPFSDEFNSTMLNKGWKINPSDGTYSLTTKPGWLSLPAGVETHVTYPYSIIGGTTIFQPVPCNCDIEVKIHIDPDTIPVGETGSIILCDAARWVNTRLHMARFFVCKYGTNSVQYYVTLADGAIGVEIQGDTCYFRIRVRESAQYCSYGTDGVTYSQEYSRSRRAPYISIGASHYVNSGGQPQSPCTGYIDYIRFTNMGQ